MVAPARSRLGSMPDSAGPTPPTNSIVGRAQEPLIASEELLQVDARLLEIEGAVAALLLEQTKLRSRSATLKAEIAAAKVHVGYDASVRDEVRHKAESFGYPQPRDYQLDGVCSVLNGTHTAVIWPAGGGKGLLTMLLSAMLPGKATVVMVPLVALANQLCDAVNIVWAGKHTTVDGRERAIAEVLGGGSDADYNERLSTLPVDLDARRAATLPRVQGAPPPDPTLREELLAGTKLARLAHQLQQPPADGQADAPLVLFLSPEKLALSLQVHAFLRRLYDLDLLGPCIIDEFHCIVDHGYDFRPHYLMIGLFVTALEWIVLLFTATAPPALLASTRMLLNIPPDVRVHEIRCPTGSLRPQMTYSVLPVASNQQRHQLLFALLAQRLGQCGIVYCPSRPTCETLAREYAVAHCGAIAASWTNGDGGVAFFHAGILPESDPEAERAWSKEDIRRASSLGQICIMFCTIAWGMGMDKPNVRFVIHWAPPKSVAAFYQEASRAGRDGEPAESFVLYDLMSWIASAQQRAGSISMTQLGRDFGLAQSVSLLAFLTEEATCRHLLIERALGDGSADALCSCQAADVELPRRCPACQPLGLLTPAPPYLLRFEWVPQLLRCAYLLRRVTLRQGSDRPPLLSQLARSWRLEMVSRFCAWQSDQLLARAIEAGVFALGYALISKYVEGELEVGREVSSWQWVLTAIVNASGHRIAETSPSLARVVLHPMFDPCVTSAPLLLPA